MLTRSVRIHEFGDADVLQIEEVDVGEPASGEALLRIHAIGLNRTEITLRSGRSPTRPRLPTGLGFEAAGVIEALSSDVAGFSIGDREALVPAYGAAQYELYAEFAIAPARCLVPIPDHISFVEAAATWAAYGAAWAGLISVGALKAGQTVIVSAASSSVGLAAIQIATRLEARPIALTRASAKVDHLRRLGATAVVVASEQEVVAAIKTLTGGKGAELVFDPVGGPGFATLARATATGGTLVLYGALETRPTVVPSFDIFARDLTIRGLSLTALARDDAKLAALKRFIGEGVIEGAFRPTIARTFPFERIADAHRCVEAGEHVGKIVIVL